MDIKERVKKFPDAPGIYIMRRKNGAIIYIGKALSLRKRVRYYFKKDINSSPRFNALMSQTAKIDYVTTSSEEEALILECDLIKKHHPRYNISLRDDKKYPFLKISINEDYPRAFITRIIKKDGARYFGPYPDVKSLRRSLKVIERVFPMRKCRGAISKQKSRPCLYFQIGECPGPCRGKAGKSDYLENVRGLCRFLEGREEEVIKSLGEEMERLSQNRQYEKAAKFRDRIKSLQKVIFMTEAASQYPLLPKKNENQLALKELKNVLKLKKSPSFIQCLDISNINGRDAVGVIVSFQNGEPDKTNYRRFKIKSVKKIDDYAMIGEVLNRHLQNIIKEKSALPKLLVMDGGRGQVSKASKVLERLKIKDLPVIGLAKEFENIYLLGKAGPLRLDIGSPGLSLLQRLRDETHRFAHTYFLKLRKRKIYRSALDNIFGIGPKKKKELLKFFGSIEMIKKAGLQDIRRVKGIDKNLAGRIKKFLKQ